MSLQFHLRNFTEREINVHIHHFGCVGVPWHDGRAQCWKSTIGHNPMGGEKSVYAPSSFVVDFAQWFKVIVDGLKLLEDVALFIASEGTDEDALIKAMKQVFKVTEDVIRAEAEKIDANLKELAPQARASFNQTCASIGVTPDQVQQIVRQVGLGPSWFFLAGNSYDKYIRQDSSPLVDHYGWSVFQANTPRHSTLRIANHAFFESGHLIQVIDDEVMDQFWKDKW